MKEKKEIRITLGTFIVGIIAIILLILVAIMGMYIATMDKKEIQQNTTTTANNNNLDINSELVKKLYSYVDYTFWANLNADTVNDFSKIMYVNGKSTIDTISNDTKLLTVIARMLETGEYTIIKEETLPQVYEEDYGTSLYEYKINDDSYWYNYENKRWEKSKGFDASDESNIVVDDDIKIFNIEAIQKTAKEIFNEELKIEKHSYTFLGEALIYDDDEYKLITCEGGGDVLWNCISNIIKAEKVDNNIYIYDNYIVSWNEEARELTKFEYNTYKERVYTALDRKRNIKPTKELDGLWRDLTIEEKDGEDYKYTLDVKKAKEEYGITVPIYKHTFKQAENGNYYWVSTELTNY